MKPLLAISCPIDTHSGYGARSRDIVKVLIESNKYDVRIIPQRWGNTPMGFLKDENEEHQKIKKHIVKSNIERQPDIWIQITIPNEFQAVGKYNIGITAGIETTVCDPSWIEGCNRMNLVLTSSQHAKDVFTNCKFEILDQKTNQVTKQLELTTPIEVLFEGVDTNIYKKIEIKSRLNDLTDILDSIDEEFCFLFVGHWLQGMLGQDRKDVGGMVKTFLETFKGKKMKPALILKTSGSGYSIMDRDQILDKIAQIQDHVGGKDLPRIYLLHGELEDDEINQLYNHSKVKAMVSFTKGEGFGRPLLEFTTSQKPLIVSGWSGQLDYLNKEFTILLPGQLTSVHPSAVVQNMILKESSWFSVDYKYASKTMEDVWKSYKKYLDLGKRQAHVSKTEFSLDKMGEKLIEILDENVPKQVPLKLPSLKSTELPKIKTL